MKQFVTGKQHHEQALESLSELIRIPSVLDESDSGEGHPFGKKVVEALDKVLEISEGLGFKTFKDPGRLLWLCRSRLRETSYLVSYAIWTLSLEAMKKLGI